MDLWMEQGYRVTLVEAETGAEVETGVVEAVSPMDAVHVYGAEAGWKPEHDSLDFNKTWGFWYMEDSGTQILVYEIY